MAGRSEDLQKGDSVQVRYQVGTTSQWYLAKCIHAGRGYAILQWDELVLARFDDLIVTYMINTVHVTVHTLRVAA